MVQYLFEGNLAISCKKEISGKSLCYHESL